MKKMVFMLVLVGIFMVAGNAFAPLITTVNDTSSNDTSVVDLRDKDTSKPVKLLR